PSIITDKIRSPFGYATGVTVNVFGFAPNTAVTLAMGGQFPATLTADAAGRLINQTYTVPANATAGQYSFTASQGAASAFIFFSVDTAGFAVSSANWRTNDPIAVTGKGFNPSTTVTQQSVRFCLGTTTLATITTAYDGTLTGSFNVLSGLTPGAASMTAHQGGVCPSGPSAGASAASVTVIADPYVSLSPSAGPAGTTITAAGSNLTNGAGSIAWDVPSANVAFTVAGGAIPANTTLIVPAGSAAGAHILTATSGATTLHVPFTVTTPTVTFVPAGAAAGVAVIAIGSGFTPNAQVDLHWDSAGGAVVATACIPWDAPAEGGGGSVSAALATAAPVLASPSASLRVKRVPLSDPLAFGARLLIFKDDAAVPGTLSVDAGNSGGGACAAWVATPAAVGPSATVTLTTTAVPGVPFAQNATAEEVGAWLATHPDVRRANVLRSLPTAAGGYFWTVSFESVANDDGPTPALPADVPQMLCDASGLSGSGAVCAVSTDIHRNRLGGSFY
ncbi:MAG: hypothetical protein NTZ05_12130, partial [Chloroflexi bacterium]|nr:hypothetical protein [Chloroflexota bacterium]